VLLLPLLPSRQLLLLPASVPPRALPHFPSHRQETKTTAHLQEVAEVLHLVGQVAMAQAHTLGVAWGCDGGSGERQQQSKSSKGCSSASIVFAYPMVFAADMSAANMSG
jgi:hypothetical protein